MIHAPLPPEAWAAEGARAARALDEVAAALVIGSDAEVTAIVAQALAAHQPPDRRVAIGDLVGGLLPLGGDRAPGLLHCFRDGRPVSEIAMPLTGDGRVFALPSGGAEVRERLVLESARWPRLVAGFREVDALLLLVALAGTPGLETLMAAVDGVVSVDVPPVLQRRWPLLATVDRPEAELPPVAPLPDRAPRPRGARRVRRWLVALGLACGLAAAAGGGAWAWHTGRMPWPPRAGAPSSGSLGARPDVPTAGDPPAEPPSAAAAPAPADTITLGPVVNPDDSARAAAYAVELVAANTLSGANSGLSVRGVRLPASTLAPVPLGADGRPWYRALTGAWSTRPEAEAFLAGLRDRGLVREDVGRVVRAPYALLLEEGMPAPEVPAAIARWAGRGIPAYALLQDDGRARVLAGAFETPGQSALVALALRELGAEPVLAFRTGRTF